MRLRAASLAILLASLTAGAALAQSSAGGGGGGGSGSTTITGTLPAFAQTPTFNVGTIAGIATETGVQQVRTALGSPFQAGGSIGNTAFGISGTLPAFAATPTFNIGALNGAATSANQANEIAALGAPADTAYAGSGNSSIVSALKGLYTAFTTRMVTYSDAGGTSVAASGAFTGAARDSGAAGTYIRATAVGYSNQAGTLSLRACADSACGSFFTLVSSAVTAGGNASVTSPLATRWWQVVLTNANSGGAASVYVYSSQTVN